MPPSLDLYCKGARVWLRDEAAVWVPGTVAEAANDDGQLAVSTGDATELIDVSAGAGAFPHLCNPDILIGNDDLTHLSYLHEPGVLHSLEVRFCENKSIYTYSGIVLVAINPYARLPIYTAEVIEQYSSAEKDAALEPHVFAIAEDAYRALFREGRNQSIIVSGESGAGKTVSAKFAMRYFASVGGAANMTQIEKKVLASNPVMEAIGNAKTTRNDNSSRFGKYIELLFSEDQHIVGAAMRTYLLEKSRVVHQAEKERNYHIFYQMCASIESELIADLMITESEDFFYTNQGDNAIVPEVDDKEDFVATVEALKTLGLEADRLNDLFQILAGLMHLGNVEVTQRSKRNEDAVVPEDDAHLPMASVLLGLEPENISKWATHRKIQTGREVFTKPLSCTDAARSIHAFTKHIYAHVFDWIVAKVNVSLAPPDKGGKKSYKTIGVLDIYGFEVFRVNSFEQFCINYANEKLQQLFNRHVFKLEQEEYVREEITWSFIDFYDNQVCIDLIEDRTGVLTLLDEQCMMPKGSDDSWLIRMHQTFPDHTHYLKPRLSSTAFIVKHYAYDVQYEVGGFLEKNKDTLYEEHLAMLRGSEVDLLATIFRDAAAAAEKAAAPAGGAAASPSKRKGKASRMTVGTQFQRSLEQLMDTLNRTDPHYIRCIKPNDEKATFEYDRKRCVEQLRACGVLETVRISAAGYPSRWTYEDFCDRYTLLAANPRAIDKASPRKSCESILRPLVEDEDKYQFGKTKLFFRAGQVAYLERLRADKRDSAAIMIQKHTRRLITRRQYLAIRAAVITFQRYARGRAARALAERLRRVRAALIVQTAYRRFCARRNFLKIVAAARLLQRHVRGHLGRKAYRAALEQDCALRIQTAWRRHKAQSSFCRFKASVIVAQSAVRRRWAMKELKALKLEARSVEGIKAKNAGLQQALASMRDELAAARAEIESQAAALKATPATVDIEAELTEARARCETQSAQAAAARAEHERALAELQVAKAALLEENERLRGAADARDDEGVGEDGEDVNALKAQVARLTLANTKLQERVGDLEKNEVRRAARVADAEADATDRLQESLQAAQAKLSEVEASRDALEEELSVTTKTLEISRGDLDSLQAKYAARLQEQGAQELAAENDELIKRAAELEGMFSAANDSATALKQKLDASLAEVDHLTVEKREVVERLKSLESGTAQKMAGKSKPSESAALQDEVVQLTEEILALREKNERYESTLAELRKNGVAIPAGAVGGDDALVGGKSAKERTPATAGNAASSGRSMIRLESANVGRLVKDLITHLDPATLRRQRPLFAAHVLFMCVLYADEKNDEELVQNLLVQVIRGIKHVTMQKAASLRFLAFWMATTFSLVNCMCQSSGERAFKVAPDTPLLENFDFSEYRTILTDVLVQIYQTVIRHIEHEITGLLVEGLLDHEPLEGIPSPIRSRDKGDGSSATADNVVARLDRVYVELEQAHLGMKLIHQVFAQVFTYINAVMVNNIMLRKDLCHWTTGIQIRRNLATVEEWSQKRGLGLLFTARFVEVTQVSQLLQVNKTSTKDLDTISETSTKLLSLQVQKILQMYTPGPGEGKVPAALIRQVAERRRSNGDGKQLMMDAANIRKPKIPFDPKPPDFASLALPSGLSISTYLSRV